MPQTATFDTTFTGHDALQRSLVPTALAVMVPVTALTVYGAHDVREIAIVMTAAVVAVAGVFGLLLPRALRRSSAPVTAVALSVVAAALVLPAFWSGLPLVLGAAGAILGYAGMDAPRGRGASIVALVLGVLSGAAYLGIYAMEALSI